MDKQDLPARISESFKVHLATMLIRAYDNGLMELYNRTLRGKIGKMTICLLGLERKFRKNSKLDHLKGSK